MVLQTARGLEAEGIEDAAVSISRPTHQLVVLVNVFLPEVTEVSER